MSIDSSRLLCVDLAAQSNNWALTDEGRQQILKAAPKGWRVHLVKALTSSDGDGPREPSAEAMDAIRDAEVYFGFGIPRPLFLNATKLKWVHSAAAGVGNSLYPEMMKSDVIFSNSAGVHAHPIAEYVTAAVLHFFRGLDVVVRQQAEAKWDKTFFVANDSPIREVGGASVLIIGAGGIGTQTAIRLSAIGAWVVDIRRHPDRKIPDGFQSVYGIDKIDDELPNADVVVLAAPLTASSSGLFDARRLKRMKRGSILINVSRGALVDERALAELLESGHLRGVALDVFGKEPLASDSPLWHLRHALLSPHISPVSPGRFWPRALELFIDNWRHYVRGAPMKNVVDKDAGY